MDAETQPAPDHHDFSSQWVDMGPYGTQQSPINDYSGFVFASSPVMPMEPSYSMSIPQPYSSQQLLPLSMPSQWPSMLSTQPGYAPVPLAPMPPMQSMAAPPPPPAHTTHYVTASTPRRTLTDADRRRMCLYHEENPTVKQTEIGAMFGVERSTVSKVLRQKEKYLYPDDGNRSPIKKAKGKFPDIEKALSNWVRNYQRQGGRQLTDAMIREKALFFASTVGGREGHQKVLTSSWLEKFKQKNCIPGSLSRRGSVDVGGNLDTNDRSEAANGFSPDSASASSSPLSPKPDPEVVGKTGSARSTPKLDSSEFAITAEAMSRSPSGSTHTGRLFSPDNPFVSAGQASNQKRPRSQTFPVSTEPGFASNSTADPVSPKSSCQTGIVVPVLDDEDQVPSEPARMRRNHSNPEIKTNMQPPRHRKSNTVSPVGGSPVSPTQDEARQALELVMSYFKNQPSGLAAQDFFTIGKLMEKLELAQSQAIAAAQTSSLQRIEEYPGAPRVSKKRSIHTL